MPEELGDLAKLRYLYLAGNDLTGPVPASMSKLSLYGYGLTADRGRLCRPASLTKSPWTSKLDVCETTATAPAAPGQPDLAPGGDRRVAVNWDAPDSGGAAVTGYSVRYRSAASSTWTTWAHTGLRTAATITGLTNGVVYHVQVAAANSVGTSGWSPPAAEQANTPADAAELDRQALIKLYNNTSGPFWKNKGSWKTTSPIRHWYGVSTDSNGRVTTLNLYNNKLAGTIPSQLGNLTQLKYLRLYNNSLSGKIPAALGNLAQLQNLDLYDNSLSGKIPSQLGSLAQLQNLRLYDNSLSGKIPSQLGSLAQLQNLRLYDNSLSGAIPSGARRPRQAEVPVPGGQRPHRTGASLDEQTQPLQLRADCGQGTAVPAPPLW